MIGMIFFRSTRMFVDVFQPLKSAQAAPSEMSILGKWMEKLPE